MAKKAKGKALTYQPPANAKEWQHDPLPPGRTKEQDIAAMVAEGLAGNTIVTQDWGSKSIALAPLKELHASITEMGRKVSEGDRSGLEQLLTSQIVSMNAVFVRMLQRAFMESHPGAFETYLRIAGRMQSQCRATSETLAQMKQPTVFAKQANIANGPQQVNNNVGSLPAVTVTRVAKHQSAPSKLLEAPRHVERVDGGTEGASLKKCVQGRRTNKTSRLRARAQSATSAAR